MKRFGLIKYEAIYEKLFVRNLRRYSSLKERIKRRVEKTNEDYWFRLMID